MKTEYDTDGDIPEKIQLNLAIVGGGSSCRAFLELLQAAPFPNFEINVVGVCDINPEAEGFVLAKKKGIYTTNDFRDLFCLENLDSIIELTNRRDVLLELIKARPKHVGVVDNNIGRFFRSFFPMNQWLQVHGTSGDSCKKCHLIFSSSKAMQRLQC